jgi:hypothetical protein
MRLSINPLQPIGNYIYLLLQQTDSAFSHSVCLLVPHDSQNEQILYSFIAELLAKSVGIRRRFSWLFSRFILIKITPLL